MAVVTTKSGPITNRDAVPRVFNNPGAAAGTLKGFKGIVTTVATDDINSVYIMGSVPSNAVMHSLRYYGPDIGASAAAVDVGLYQTTANGGAVVDADFFTSALNLNAGALNGTDILYEANSAYPIGDAEKPLWSALALSADPCIMYDVCLTATGAIDAAVVVALQGTYAV